MLGNQGACVIAKGYEMKATGVKTGTAVWDAKRMCSEGIFIKRDFHWYEAISRKMLGVVREHSPAAEYYSIDEFFFRAESLRAGQHLQTTATTIRDRILDDVRVPVTIGIARTRTLAKLFSGTSKPFGALAVLDRDHERELLGELNVTEISGDGERRAPRVTPYGIRTCLDLADADGRMVNELLTKTGYEVWRELNGVPVHPIRTSRPAHQTLSRGGSLAGHVASKHELWGWAVRNLERLVEELEYHRVRAGRMSVAVAYHEGFGRGGTVDLDSPSDRFEELIDPLRATLRKAWVTVRTRKPGRSIACRHSRTGRVTGRAANALAVSHPGPAYGLYHSTPGRSGRGTGPTGSGLSRTAPSGPTGPGSPALA